MNSLVRARDAAQKADRRDAILNAATALYREQGRLPTAAKVAQRTGLAKGTVYLYFGSKEEIYLAVLEHAYLAFLYALSERLRRYATLNEKQISTAIINTIKTQPDFLSLAVIAQSVLEQNASADALAAYKRSLAQGFGQCVNVIAERSQREITPVVQALLCSYALMLGLWQMANPPPKLKDMAIEPECRLMEADFEREMQFSLERIWRELPVSGNSQLS